MRIKNELLRKLRLERGWRQVDAAEAAKIDERTYRRYETGQANHGSSETSYSKQYEILRDLAAVYELAGPEELIDFGAARASHPEIETKPEATHSPDAPQPPDAPYHPSWYIHREAAERRALNRLRGAGAPVVLQGPQFFGKSTMLGYLLEKVVRGPALPHANVRINLAAVDPIQISTLDGVLRAIGRGLVDESGHSAEALLTAAWQRPGTPMNRLSWLLEQRLSERSLLLVLEKADSVHGNSYQGEFFAMLRGFAESARRNPWSHLRLIVTVATEPSLLESTDHSSFFVLANPIMLDELDEEQVAEMARLHGLSPARSDLDQLMQLVGGIPYLVRLAFYECVLNEYSLPQLLEHLSSVFASHLMRLRAWLQVEGLFPVIQNILLHADTEIPFEQYCALYAKGLLKETSAGIYRLRCRLYEEYFSQLCRRK